MAAPVSFIQWFASGPRSSLSAFFSAASYWRLPRKQNPTTVTRSLQHEHDQATASADTVILAIDLRKYKSVACVHEPATGEFRFATFDIARNELRNLIAKEQPAVGKDELAFPIAASELDLDAAEAVEENERQIQTASGASAILTYLSPSSDLERAIRLSSSSNWSDDKKDSDDGRYYDLATFASVGGPGTFVAAGWLCRVVSSAGPPRRSVVHQSQTD